MLNFRNKLAGCGPKRKGEKTMWWFYDSGWVALNNGDYGRVWDGLDVNYGTGYHEFACSATYGCDWVY